MAIQTVWDLQKPVAPLPVTAPPLVTQPVQTRAPSPIIVSSALPAIKNANALQTNINQLSSSINQQAQQNVSSANLPASQILANEQKNIAQYGQPTQQVANGPLTSNPSLPAGFVQDTTGRIFQGSPTVQTGATGTGVAPAPIATSTPQVQQQMTVPTQEQITKSRNSAVQGLYNQGITDPDEIKRLLDESSNASGKGSSDFTKNEIAAKTPQKYGTFGQYSSALDQINKLTNDAYKSYRDQITGIMAGSMPLSEDEQATVNMIASKYDSLAQSQALANENYTAATTQAGISSGRNRYAPEIELGNIKKSIDQGIAKISEINQQAVSAVLEAKMAFKKQNYQMATDSYDRLSSLLDKRSTQIENLMSQAQDHEDKIRTYNLEVSKFKEDQRQNDFRNTIDSDKFTWQQKQDTFLQIMESDKFSWQKKQDDIKNMLDSDKFTWDQKKDMLQYNLESDKFTWQQKLDQFDQVMDTNKFTWQQQQDLIDNALDSNKFTYQQEKDLQDRKLEIEKLSQTDNAIAREEWLAAGQPGSFASFLSEKNAKPATVDELTSARFATRMKDSQQIINSLEETFMNMNLLDQHLVGVLPNAAKSADQQRLEQAEKEYLSGILRKDSGAAVSDSELQRYMEQYFPVAGDKPENIRQKRESRQRDLLGMVNSAGNGLSKQFRESVISGKKNYTNIQSIVADHPEYEGEIDTALKNGADYNQLLQFYSDKSGTNQTTTGFKQVLSMTRNGSNGSLSARFESSGDPGSIGYDSTGGYSYGTYQLAHSNAAAFVKQSPYASEFKGIPFNSKAFQNKWKEIAKTDPNGFKQAQESYIQTTHVQPQLNKLAEAGFDPNKLSPTLKEVIFSTAVQHGPNNNIILKALKLAGPNASEADIIKKIYNERWSGGDRFANSTAEVKRAVYNRFFGKDGELATALRNLSNYT